MHQIGLVLGSLELGQRLQEIAELMVLPTFGELVVVGFVVGWLEVR